MQQEQQQQKKKLRTYVAGRLFLKYRPEKINIFVRKKSSTV